MRPLLATVLRDMGWAARRDWRLAPHLARALLGFAAHTAAGRWRRLIGRGQSSVTIALIEHMGDIVAAEPVSRHARARFPAARIAWVVRAPYAEVVGNYPAVDRIETVSCMTEWLLLWASGAGDVVWDLHISERPCPRCGVYVRKPGAPGAITYRNYLDLGGLLTVNCLSAGIAPLAEAPVLRPDAAAVAAVDALGLPARFVAIHCRSSEARRDWTAEGWRGLVDWLTEEAGVAVIEVGSEPYAIGDDAVSALRRSVCGLLSIMRTAEVIRRAVLFVGVESGPGHIANAVGTPGVIVTGAYASFASYMPYSGAYADGSGADLVRATGPAREVPLAAVTAAVARRLGIAVAPRPQS